MTKSKKMLTVATTSHISEKSAREMKFSALEANRIIRFLLNLDEEEGAKNRFAKEAVIQKAALALKGGKEERKFNKMFEIANEKGLDFILKACQAYQEGEKELTEEKEEVVSENFDTFEIF
jgi:hypothetical protein